ncbi:unnamed protein product [Heligmosomoides polygyrus]|uniref:CC domain-containing protein n=1 Tax=Heligmosomoides polygyrus TaxID=6339 RepID=A0A183G2B6_HELPZ|nr:unnamed protein product [Heligmosomoides polygyrus]
MGLLVSDVSCMGPPIPCTFCPSQMAMYKDCTPYGRIQCLTLPMISAAIQQTATQCEFNIICAPGTLLYLFNTPLATPVSTGGPTLTLTCPLPPGAPMWNSITGGVAGVTCMSNP